jgi:3D (Asp-Asp-Asp) domain-containing protein
MFLTRSLKQKIAATCGAVFGMVLFYEVTMLDSKTTVAQDDEIQETTAKPAPGIRLRFAATAYCKGTTTASGTNVRTGIAAADPDLLPVGTVIQIDSLGQRYNGIYTILDTGPAVQGRHIDLYMWSCNEALAFGAKKVQLNVLRLGWNPRASNPTVIRSILDQRERQMAAPQETPPPASIPPAQESQSPETPAAPSGSAPSAPAVAPEKDKAERPASETTAPQAVQPGTLH